MNHLKIPELNLLDEPLFNEAFSNNAFSSLDDMDLDFNEQYYAGDLSNQII